ncbi:uncharacterized protein B0T15DRAFT_79786 [Chaetomium strumarium]|uniref:Zn(2)-C6 fungal-type domain-containing protein n=1 Tax=Chaetomium strumarium TaxID=1170767 RepID=A0AAJ0H4F4_9PEZI|nr:hypothetical protein B0T15DRAFT_79786 [Chaetomium strumarium]
MVGVPGRSKSCGTCRRRKKGNCDRQRPSCSQCLAKGLTCDGYGRETIFVNATSAKVKQYRVNEYPPEADNEQAHDTIHGGDAQGSKFERQHAGVQREGESEDLALQQRRFAAAEAILRIPDSGVTEALARTAHEERYLGGFWQRYLPEARDFPSRAAPYTNGGWMVALPRLYASSPVIRKVMLAVCLATEGQASGREREREEGLRYYTASLRRMAGALADRDPERGRADHTTLVVAARLFSMYEVHCGHNALDLPAQAESWCKHIEGELALIMSRPPQDYASGYMHQFWVDGRLHLASCFLQMRKRAPMSDPGWMTIPWQTIPKTPKDLIIDILIETTGLREDYDALKTQDDPQSRDALRRELIQRCWRLESELAVWLSTVHNHREPDVLSADAPFSIDVLAAAHVMCIYWIACIVTYSTLRDLLSAAAPEEIARLPPHMDPRVYFRRIAEAVNVMLHPSSGIFGAQLTYFPTAVVMSYHRDFGGGDEDVKTMIFGAYRRAGKDMIAERFLASLREQEARRGGRSNCTIP